MTLTRAESGQRIKEARQEAGLSVEELARKTDVSVWTIVAWQRGDREPRREHLHAIANATGKTVGWLFGEEE